MALFCRRGYALGYEESEAVQRATQNPRALRTESKCVKAKHSLPSQIPLLPSPFHDANACAHGPIVEGDGAGPHTSPHESLSLPLHAHTRTQAVLPYCHRNFCFPSRLLPSLLIAFCAFRNSFSLLFPPFLSPTCLPPNSGDSCTFALHTPTHIRRASCDGLQKEKELVKNLKRRYV